MECGRGPSALRPQFLKLLEKVTRGSRPDIRGVADWLSQQDPTGAEWAEITPVLQSAYNIPDVETFRRTLVSPPEYGKGSYVDDFNLIMEEYDIGGWLRRYVEHTRGMEAPTAFHFGASLTVLAAALRRKAFVDMGYFKIWPAIQTLLAGPSGKVKKSTAAQYAVDLAMDADESLFHLLPDEGSGEALKTELGHNCKKETEATGLLFVSEMSTFVGEQQYNSSLVQQLTDLFDSRNRKRRRTHSAGNIELKNICVSALFCSNDEWLADAVPVSAFGGGLFGRMLLFYQPDTDRCFAFPQMRDPKERQDLQQDLLRIKFILGNMKNSAIRAHLENDASLLYEDLYGEIKRDWPKDERLNPFWERLSPHLLRIGMLLAISDDMSRKERILVKERHIAQADALLKWVLKYLPSIYVSLGSTAYGKEYQRVLAIIKQNKGMVEDRELGRQMASRMSRRKLKEVLDSMVGNGIIKKVKVDEWEGSYGWRLMR